MNERRPKKQMHFQSHEEMVRYIENFRQNFKTELCRNWEETGACEFAQECAYAHGQQELQNKAHASHKNYKTKLCKKWHVTTPGKCSYRGKCQFIHDEGSAKSQMETNNQLRSFQQRLGLNTLLGIKMNNAPHFIPEARQNKTESYA